jgi:phage gpG-like protein
MTIAVRSQVNTRTQSIDGNDDINRTCQERSCTKVRSWIKVNGRREWLDIKVAAKRKAITENNHTSREFSFGWTKKPTVEHKP